MIDQRAYVCGELIECVSGHPGQYGVGCHGGVEGVGVAVVGPAGGWLEGHGGDTGLGRDRVSFRM